MLFDDLYPNVLRYTAVKGTAVKYTTRKYIKVKYTASQENYKKILL